MEKAAINQRKRGSRCSSDVTVESREQEGEKTSRENKEYERVETEQEGFGKDRA